MDLYRQAVVFSDTGGRAGIDKDPLHTLSDTKVAYADVFQELAEHGRFDEDGGELSDEDWADSQ